jgi:CcmD family protein
MQNGGYLFAAYSIIWVVIFGYVFFMARKQASLKRQMESIKKEREQRQAG